MHMRVRLGEFSTQGITQTNLHTCMHTHTHNYARSHTHIHTHTHTYFCLQQARHTTRTATIFSLRTSLPHGLAKAKTSRAFVQPNDLAKALHFSSPRAPSFVPVLVGLRGSEVKRQGSAGPRPSRLLMSSTAGAAGQASGGAAKQRRLIVWFRYKPSTSYCRVGDYCVEITSYVFCVVLRNNA